MTLQPSEHIGPGGGKREGQGRPVGYLIAWLLWASRNPGADRDAHDRAKKWMGGYLSRYLRREARNLAKEWAKTMPLLAAVLRDAERKQRDGEAEEPDEI